jgi:hypothetical protein
VTDATGTGPALDAAQLTVPALPARNPDAASEIPSSLPRDHPAWQRDVLAVSARVRAVIACLRPVAVHVLTFWDHARRTAIIRGRRLDVDPSGCYRLR